MNLLILNKVCDSSSQFSLVVMTRGEDTGDPRLPFNGWKATHARSLHDDPLYHYQFLMEKRITEHICMLIYPDTSTLQGQQNKELTNSYEFKMH